MARKGVQPDRYGLMPGEREGLERRQANKCAICGKPPKSRRLHVDHHHACAKWDKRGSVRGLLCFHCNVGLLREDPTLLRRAAAYFEAHQCSPKPQRARKPKVASDSPTAPLTHKTG